MNLMQRSFSLPGHSHASPPLSPTTVDLDSSRSPTPAPIKRFSKPQWLLGPESSYTTGQGPFKQTVVAQKIPDSNGLRSSAEKSEASTTSNGRKIPYLPLLQDVSQYMNFRLGEVIQEATSTTLEEFAHLVRLSNYQERKQLQSRVRLHRSLVSTALSARLARCGDLAHRTLVDNFRADDKKNFAILYNAIYDVRNSCDATRRYALLEPELDSGRSKIDAANGSGSFSTFMHEIPDRARETLLVLMTQIRTNPDFLATRISNLTSSELSALTLFHRGLEPIESVLPFYSRVRGHNPSSNRNSIHVPTAIERLLSFQRHDPLSTLIHTCFANSAGPDSAEDLRRTDIWATVCAKLITESRSGVDSFICSVLNIWTAMRDWSGKSNMEWYLMKTLEDGAFLLEKAEDQAGTRIHVEPRNAKDSIAADEFYDAAVKGLFEIMDDPGAGGIPEGLTELGNAILRKLDPKRHQATKLLLVSKWLFSVFLTNAVIHPESYGMMAEYHITEYGRQKILKEVAMRVQRSVVDLTWKQSAAIPPDIRSHIESIMGRFQTAKHSKSNPKLLPARSITSLRETVEVHPYLVVSPADFVTMVNALFPDRQAISSSVEKEIHFSGLRSGASSISGMSGMSMPTAVPPQSRGFDTASVISNSGSSVFSDTTSREPLLDDGSSNNRFSSTSISSMSQGPRTEDDAQKFRVALKEMCHALGTDVTSGSCHPCAEQWAVLFVDSDGQNLSTQMIHDCNDDVAEEEEDTSSSESDLELSGTRPDLDKDYHQLRDSILKLVEDYEIPLTPDIRNRQKTFSNKTSIEGLRKKKQARNKPSQDAPFSRSRNPFWTQDQSPQQAIVQNTEAVSTETDQENDDVRGSSMTDDQPPMLLKMLEAAESQCRAQSDFFGAHLYWRTLQQLQQLSSSSLRQNGFVSLLNIFSRGPRDSLRRSASAIEEYDAWLVWLKQSQERHDVTIETMMKRVRALRDKMWYVTDVRNSAAYENARAVAVALKTMGTPRVNKTSNSSRPRNTSRTATNNFLLKTEAQILDILAATEEHGGPNKLSDDQADKTASWLSQCGIENFCRGEERIHRFCLEIETCINKLVGDSLMEGPVLWSSELYYRDKRILDSGRQKGDLVVTKLGSLSIASDFGHEIDSGRRSVKSFEMTSPIRSGIRDLGSMSARNSSQQSFDSSRWSISRSSTGGDIMDSQDYFGTTSPVLTIDSATTFWSPFHTRIQSPSTSVSSYRLGSASSTNETVMLTGSEGANVVAKQQFLTELKQILTSLLISDLGTLVFARGSETDTWFSGDLGQDCMERRDRQDRKTCKKKRVIEKKRSFRDLRSAQRIESPVLEQPEIRDERRERATGIVQRPVNGNLNPESQSQADSSSTASDSLSNTSLKKQGYKDAQSVDFPYKAAFHRLLKMFSVHPNPFVKLTSLYELERLIVASIMSVRRQRSIRHDAAPGSPLSSSFPVDQVIQENRVPSSRAKNLDKIIDNVKERQSHAFYQTEEFSNPRKANDNRSITASSSASTDMIIDVLQDLLREADMRPKTLFRDLQFIAAFIPASILDKTEQGKAFWNAGLAALGLKQDVCRTLIEIADEIVLHYTQTRQTSANVLTETKDAMRTHVMKYGMQDAAKMWTITAKEGDPVAERELAIFYLTHPELVERTTLPLTKPKETFKAQVMEMHGGGGNGGKEGDLERSDPATMCVAYHWMELSANGGDELAKKYLRQREELNALP